MKPAKYSDGKPRKSLSFLLVVLIVAAGILLLMVNFITDWMWFAEMKYVDVFFKGLYTQIKIGIPILVVVMLLLE